MYISEIKYSGKYFYREYQQGKYVAKRHHYPFACIKCSKVFFLYGGEYKNRKYKLLCERCSSYFTGLSNRGKSKGTKGKKRPQ